MMEQIIDAIGIKATDDQIVEVIHQILNKTFKGSDKGLVYGFGHAVYTCPTRGPKSCAITAAS